jgi:hypothetical protein
MRALSRENNHQSMSLRSEDLKSSETLIYSENRVKELENQIQNLTASM